MSTGNRGFEETLWKSVDIKWYIEISKSNTGVYNL